MRVYVAGPISNGENKEMGYQVVCDNIRNAILVGNQIADMGMSPMVPHLTHFFNLIAPREYLDWLRIDDEWVAASDAVFRMPGASKGADRECLLAEELGIPVFYTLEGLNALYIAKFKTPARQAPGDASGVNRLTGGSQLLYNSPPLQPGEVLGLSSTRTGVGSTGGSKARVL